MVSTKVYLVGSKEAHSCHQYRGGGGGAVGWEIALKPRTFWLEVTHDISYELVNAMWMSSWQSEAFSSGRLS